jgi:hypothetical protein
MTKRSIKVFTSILACLFLATITAGNRFIVVRAQSESTTSFSIQTTRPVDANSKNGSYFTYELQPGSQINDEALVINSGSEPVTLRLIAADGLTGQNGGTALIDPGNENTSPRNRVGNWVQLSTNQVTLQPGEQVMVPFTITVPADAEAGQHIGGLLVEDVNASANDTSAQSGDGQIVVHLVKRVGLAIVVTIPGEFNISLSVDQIRFVSQSEQGTTFAVTVSNQGNILTNAEGNLLITDKENNVLSSLPIKLDTILPGDSTIIYLNEPLSMADGDYIMSVGIIYDGKTAMLENQPLKLRQGKAPEETPVTTISPTQEIMNIQPEKYSSDEWGVYLQDHRNIIFGILLGIGLVFILIIAGLIWKKHRNH